MKKLRKVGDGIEPGPIEAGNWPDKLKAHVVTPGHAPRIHGYDVESDLVVNYNYLSILLLTLLGELPNEKQVELLRVAMSFIAPISVAEAPVHAAVVSRVSGAQSESILGIGAACLAEQARHLLNQNQKLLCWLENPDSEIPSTAKPKSDEDRASSRRCRLALEQQGFKLDVMNNDMGRDATILAILHHAGIRSQAHFELVFVVARLPSVVSEALAVGQGALNEYPIRLPEYRYEEETPS